MIYKVLYIWGGFLEFSRRIFEPSTSIDLQKPQKGPILFNWADPTHGDHHLYRGFGGDTFGLGKKKPLVFSILSWEPKLTPKIFSRPYEKGLLTLGFPWFCGVFFLRSTFETCKVQLQLLLTLTSVHPVGFQQLRFPTGTFEIEWFTASFCFTNFLGFSTKMASSKVTFSGAQKINGFIGGYYLTMLLNDSMTKK